MSVSRRQTSAKLLCSIEMDSVVCDMLALSNVQASMPCCSKRLLAHPTQRVDLVDALDSAHQAIAFSIVSSGFWSLTGIHDDDDEDDTLMTWSYHTNMQSTMVPGHNTIHVCRDREVAYLIAGEPVMSWLARSIAQLCARQAHRASAPQ
jgi:hypothetical protein